MNHPIRFFANPDTWSRGFLFAAMLFLAACASTPSAEEKIQLARQNYDEAVRMQTLNKNNEMLDKLREAVRLAPDEPLYQITLANALFSLEKLEEAEIHYKLALDANPQMIEAYRQLGRLYMQKGDWPNAQTHLEEALKRPGLARPHELYNWLAITHYALGDFNKAEKNWLAALNILENFEIRLNLARAYRDHELFDLAQNTLEKALELNPKSAQVHYELAQLYLKNRQFPKAHKHFTEVIRLEPMGDLSKASRKYLELMPPESKNGG